MASCASAAARVASRGMLLLLLLICGKVCVRREFEIYVGLTASGG